VCALIALPTRSTAQTESLGKVDFAVTCEASVREDFSRAVALEERTPKPAVTPGAIIPARELLGDLYMTMGDPARAREAYQASDDRVPGRFNSLLGIACSSVALGDAATARASYRHLLDGARGDSTRPGVSEARTYVTGEG